MISVTFYNGESARHLPGRSSLERRRALLRQAVSELPREKIRELAMDKILQRVANYTKKLIAGWVPLTCSPGGSGGHCRQIICPTTDYCSTVVCAPRLILALLSFCCALPHRVTQELLPRVASFPFDGNLPRVHHLQRH